MTVDLEQRLRALEEERIRWSRSNVPRALETTETMMRLTEGAEPGLRALALRAHSSSLRAVGRLPEALEAVTLSQQLWRDAGEEIELARTVTAAIPILVQLDRNREAVSASKAALTLFLQKGEKAAAARLLNNMGAMNGNMGRPLAALECFTQGRELARETGQADLQARFDQNSALVLQQLGRHDESLTACARALRYWLKVGGRVAAARVLLIGAIGLFHLGRFGKALRRFSRARALFESEASRRDVAVCDLYIAGCYLELNRYDQTMTRVRTALEGLDPAQSGFQYAWGALYEGVALGRLGKPDAALQALSRAWKWFEQHGHNAWAGKARLEQIDLLMTAEQPRQVIAAARRAARLFEAAHMPVEEARAYLWYAEANLRISRVGAAERAAQRAYPVFVRSNMPGPTFRCLHLLGRLAMARQDWRKARQFLSRAVAMAERVRATVHLTFRRGFLEDKASAYGDLVLALLHLGKVREAHRVADQAKSRGLVDQLTTPSHHERQGGAPRDERLLAAIEEARRQYQALTMPPQLGPEEAVGLRSGAGSLTALRTQAEEQLAALWDEWELRQTAQFLPVGGAQPENRRVHSRLPVETAMVEHFVANSQIIAFVSDKRGLRGWVDLGPIERVRKALELLQLNLDAALVTTASGGPTPPGLVYNARMLLRDLHEWLWAPLAPMLGERRRVVVIPHGILHILPYEALYDGRQYLAETTEISLAPSRAAWVRCLDRAAALRPAHDLVVGFNAGGLLPFVDEEARRVAEALGITPLLHDQAKGEAITSGGAPLRVMHIAVHGEFRVDNPYFSTLLLADGPVTAADVAGKRLEASMVVLSGCETGLSRITRGEELMGMVAAFLQAGAATVLASRWRVDDRVTAQLMERFYADLLAGQPKAAALRNAQAALVSRNLHPLYWAAFSLTGDSGRLT